MKNEILDEPLNTDIDIQVKRIIRWIGIIRLLFIGLLLSFFGTMMLLFNQSQYIYGDHSIRIMLIGIILIFLFSLIYNIPQMFREVKLSPVAYRKSKLRIFSLLSLFIVLVHFGMEVFPLIAYGLSFNFNGILSWLSLTLLILFIPMIIILFIRDVKYIVANFRVS